MLSQRRLLQIGCGWHLKFFLNRNNQNKVNMKKRLIQFTYVPGTTMNDHVTSFNQLVIDLVNMDEAFKDEDFTMMLLGSLPKEF